ncbi:hypothetical protein [Limnoglobus roseus]|uniref:Uncharacterized protein n=1 Tax=Limnoglobus roseus TaxID=2598579 RepID=A0A5C1AQY9_9BACT|nr:hypothetical protein [Limnoglobus roseus]QEL19614.1 hypothetical protein PX52LOC_06690 [Limnoglobus roseus]
MKITCISDLLPVARERMPDVAEPFVEELAAFLWDEGYDRGCRGGDDWSRFLDSLPADMRNYRHRTRRPKSAILVRRHG